MTVDKSLLAGSTTMLVLKLLDGQDMYGYQMIPPLRARVRAQDRHALSPAALT
jgi:PadR family transcriptional regulator PadR